MGDMPARTPGPWSVGDATGRMVVREVPDMCDGGDYYSVAVTTAHSLLPEGEALANTAFIVEACNQHEALKRRADLVEPLVEALRAHQLWEKREKEGPLYPWGMKRDDPGGEAVWRAWWNDQLRLCARSHDLTVAALQAYEAAQ